jgi:transcriptional regulator with XRE-family HTH domain
MKLTMAQVRQIEKLNRAFRRLPDLTGSGMTAGRQIRLIRNRLGMTQAQLAKRAGMPQPHLHRIESEKSSPRLDTLRKIFGGLGCSLEVYARPEIPLDEYISEQAAKLADLKVRQLMGTMALEKQAPDRATALKLLREEREKLVRKPGSELWEE